MVDCKIGLVSDEVVILDSGCLFSLDEDELEA